MVPEQHAVDVKYRRQLDISFGLRCEAGAREFVGFSGYRERLGEPILLPAWAYGAPGCLGFCGFHCVVRAACAVLFPVACVSVLRPVENEGVVIHQLLC